MKMRNILQWLLNISIALSNNIDPIIMSWLSKTTMEIRLQDNSTSLIYLKSVNDCLFSGKLNDDPASVVTVIGCMDDGDTTVSIASALVSDGLVDLMIINGSTSVLQDDKVSRERKKRSASFDQNDALRPPPGVLQEASSNFIGSRSWRYRALPKAVNLKTIIWYDQSLLKKFNGDHYKTKLWISRVVELAKPRLAHHSLKVRINLLVEDIKESKLRLKATKSNIRMLTKNGNKNDNKDRLNSYFCYDLGKGSVGIAWIGTACDKNGWAVNINEYYTVTNSELNSAKTFVHEIGHNIGME